MARGLSNLIRGGGIAEVGSNAWAVYLVLRDHVWRSKEVGLPELQEAAAVGVLATVMRRKRIADMTGMSESTVKRAIATLKSSGWIALDRKEGRLTTYVLGRVDGGERYFADDLTRVTGDPDPGQVDPGQVERAGSPVAQTRVTGDPNPGHGRPGHSEQAIEQAKEQATGRALRKTKKRTDAVPTEDDRGDPTPRPPPRRAWADMPDEEDPVPAAPVEEEGGRRVHPDEARRLASARAKAARGAKGEYSSVEVVAVWRAEYFAAFGGEDTDLETIAQQQRAARTVATRVRRWCAGDVTRLLAYLGAMIRLWRDKKPDARFPSSATPRLATLLKQGRDGRSTFWRDWEMRRR